MSNNNNDIASEIINTLEKIIDARFEYLLELTYENHQTARKVLEEKYGPEMDKLQLFIEKTLTNK